MLSSRNLLALTGLAALLAAFVLFIAVMMRPGADSVLATAGAEPTSTSATTTSGTATVTSPATATTTPESEGYSADHRGYLGTSARCPEGQSAVAFGRTQRSMVAICTTPGDGPYEYRGVRIRDGATLQTEADVTDNGFVARTDGATYTVTPNGLTVVSGGQVIYGDTWIDYRRPRYSAENGTAPATASPTTTTTTGPTTTGPTTSSTASTSTTATTNRSEG